MPQGRRKALIAATAAMSILASLVGLEIVARVLGDEPYRPDHLEEDVWVGAWKTTLERRRSPDPMCVTELVPNQRTCGESGCVTINERGFRRALDAPPFRDTGTTTIVMVGDSFTFGYGVNDEQTVPAQLERRFFESGRSEIRVLNLGMNGSNCVQASRTVTTRAYAFKPKVVVYCYSLNDPEAYWQEGNPTLTECRPLFRAAPLYQRVLTRSRLFEIAWLGRLHRARARARESDSDAPYFCLIHRPGWPGMWATSLALGEMKQAADKIGATLLVAFLPDEITRETAARTTGRVAHICSKLGIPTLDLLDAYLGRSDRSELWTDHGPSHFNELGNRLIADEILKYLN